MSINDEPGSAEKEFSELLTVTLAVDPSRPPVRYGKKLASISIPKGIKRDNFPIDKLCFVQKNSVDVVAPDLDRSASNTLAEILHQVSAELKVYLHYSYFKEQSAAVIYLYGEKAGRMTVNEVWRLICQTLNSRLLPSRA